MKSQVDAAKPEEDEDEGDCTACQPGKFFCPDKGILSGGNREFENETSRILHSRLSAVTLLLFSAVLVFFIRSLFLPQGPSHLLCAWPLLVLAAAGVLLRSRISWTRLRLRMVELTVFGTIAAHIFVFEYQMVTMLAAAGDETAIITSINRFALSYLLLMTCYGIFVPNNWHRATMNISPMAIAPLALVALLRQTSTNFQTIFDANSTFETVSFVILVMLIGAVTAILGSKVIETIRTNAAEAKQMGVYHIEKKIGEGGMGEVWLARHKMLARPAAIKMVRPETLATNNAETSSTVTQRFEREAQTTASLRSPHTVQLYDFGVTDSGTFFYAMEYLDGLGLDTLVERFGPLPQERAAYLLRQATLSLSEAHQRGLIHRDIKPSNLHVCTLGVEPDFLKVLDFGLVKLAALPAGSDPQLTSEASTTGTPAYMPPEIALGNRPIDARSDIYALGCVAYWLLTGHPVFDSTTPMEMIVDHVKTTPVPPSQRSGVTVSPDFERVILSCLEKDPDLRPRTMEALNAAIGACDFEKRWTQERASDWWGSHSVVAA